MSDLNLDLASAILRIEQAWAERGTPRGNLLLLRLQSDARRLRAHLPPAYDLDAADAREITLATLAGTAVTRPFLGGPLDGEERTVAADQFQVVAVEQPEWSAAVFTSRHVEAQRLKQVVYNAKAFADPVEGLRYVMVAPNVRDVDHALYQWLAKRWLREAPERRP